MKQPIKLLLGITAAASVTGLAFFGWSVKAKDDTTVQLADGVQITPVEVKSDDVAQLLDVKMWKFDVYLPHPEKGDMLTINLYQHGHWVKAIAGGGFGPSRNPRHHAVVTIGIVPVGGDFSSAHQVKWMIKNDEFGTSSNLSVNPFQTSKNLNWKSQADENSNLVYLMSGTNSATNYGDARMNDAAIALEVKNTF